MSEFEKINNIIDLFCDDYKVKCHRTSYQRSYFFSPTNKLALQAWMVARKRNNYPEMIRLREYIFNHLPKRMLC